MALTPRPEGRLNLTHLPTPQTTLPPSGSSTSNTSPIEPAVSSSMKAVFGGTNIMGPSSSTIGGTRLGAGSPLHDQTARLFPKRTRELQTRGDGLSPSIWGPPTSGNSTPLRETIPESPSQDGFPDLVPPSEMNITSPSRRARAGTVPSRFSPVGTINGVNVQQQSLLSKTSRPTPSTSPFKTGSTPAEISNKGPPNSANNAALLSRLRAGSMPQRANFLGTSSP